MCVSERHRKARIKAASAISRFYTRFHDNGPVAAAAIFRYLGPSRATKQYKLRLKIELKAVCTCINNVTSSPLSAEGATSTLRLLSGTAVGVCLLCRVNLGCSDVGCFKKFVF